jgi:hypothetical protein
VPGCGILPIFPNKKHPLVKKKIEINYEWTGHFKLMFGKKKIFKTNEQNKNSEFFQFIHQYSPST